jgi:hypothetical protein
MTVGDATQVVNKVVQDCAAQGYDPIQLSGDGTVGISWLTIPQFNGNVGARSDLLLRIPIGRWSNAWLGRRHLVWLGADNHREAQ